MNLIIRWLLNALTLIGIAYYLPGIGVSGFYAAFVTALVLGLLNAIIKPVIIFFTLPINILTLGLFTLVINTFLFWLAGTMVKGFVVVGFWPAFSGAIILTLVNWLFSGFLKR